MTNVEIEQLKNDLEVKVGTLRNKIKTGEITDDSALEIVNSFNEYEKDGVTIEELKLIYEDVLLALS